ncbi:protein ALP1-like [Sitophilus oryzae]|uniref:Protein ALP1-like n=1 Tax=Sitophilus oryzae TaxID=7048 RepID=A0A6J2XEL8_SITOR|nr:protein ALP1-like [Sitophilus oryzae]
MFCILSLYIFFLFFPMCLLFVPRAHLFLFSVCIIFSLYIFFFLFSFLCSILSLYIYFFCFLSCVPFSLCIYFFLFSLFYPNMDEEALLSLAFVLCMYNFTVQSRRRRIRQYKTRPINRGRRGFNYYDQMKLGDPQQFFKYTRMNVAVFEKLLTKVAPVIRRQNRSDGISAEHRLIITLQYLSQGTSMQNLAWTFQIGHTTVHKIIHETCRAIWNVLSPEYLKSPSTAAEWLNISHKFTERWNFPHCVGALDGKHINIRAPARSGSLFYNYKNTFSIVLLAACDSKYCFTLVDIGAYGSQSDGGIFRHSIFGQRREENDLNIPEATTLNGCSTRLPYFLVADEAFPLKSFIMRPYGGRNLTDTQRIFNYRLSRARQVIENTFGILVARWRILQTTINAKIENVDEIVKAVTVLHNHCQIELGNGENGENIYCPQGFVDTDDENGSWRDGQTSLRSVGRLSSNTAQRFLYSIRDSLAQYFISPHGAVAWQNNVINNGRLF